MFFELEVKMTLTKWELSEADAIVNLWRALADEERELCRIQKDLEEMLLTEYAKAKGKLSSIKGGLRNVAGLIGVVHDTYAAIGPIEMVLSGSGIGLVVRKAMSLAEQIEHSAGNNPGIKALASLIVTATGAGCADLTFATLPFYETCVEKLDDVEDGLREAQKSLRGLMKKKSAFEALSNSVRGLTNAWAGGSQARKAYLASKNIRITPASVQCSLKQESMLTNGNQVKTSRRLKAEKAILQRKEIGDAKAAPEKPWQVSCVTATGTVLRSFSLLLSETSGRLLGILKECYIWNPKDSRGNRTIGALRRFLTTGNSPWFTIDNRRWYRIKVGKYRMLVFADSEKRTLLLMAGHRTELYRSIGRSKNES
jgi:hypothetical protein